MSNKIRVSINQPSYIPWCGYFEYIYASDVFVFLDDVQYSTSGWAHRNKIKIHNNHTMWLSVPIIKKNKSDYIKNIRINYNEDWIKKHKNSLTTYYGKSKYFKYYKNEFFSILDNHYEFLSDLDWNLLDFYCRCLGIKRKIIKSSDICISGKGYEKVINICKSLGATHYYGSGITSRHLYRNEDFEAGGIILEYQNYTHPIYPQLWGDFIPYLGILDFLFNAGRNFTLKDFFVIRSFSKGRLA